MSGDFIDKMRRDAEEAAKKPRQLEPWEIARKKEYELRARNAAIGEQYLQESGCVAYCKKLKAFLESQDSGTNAHWYIDSADVREGEGIHLTFYWHPKGVQHDFKVVAKVDGTLVFTGRYWPTVGTSVTLVEWRNDRLTIDRAFEKVYQNPQVWDQEYKNHLRELRG